MYIRLVVMKMLLLFEETKPKSRLEFETINFFAKTQLLQKKCVIHAN